MSIQGSLSSTPDIIEEPNDGNLCLTPDIIEEPNDVSVPKLKATEDKAKEIFDKLKKGIVPKVTLIGETGTGKTWMAKKICDYSAVENHPEPIWISLDKKHDVMSLKDTIARQFAIPTSINERDESERKDKKEKIKLAMIRKLEAAKKAGKIVLLVLDGQLDTIEMGIEDNIKTDILGLSLGDGVRYKDTLKVLITRREIEDNESVKFELEPFSVDEAIKLLSQKVVRTVKFSGPFSPSPAFEKACDAIRQKNWKPAPAEILILAGTLNYIANYRKEELEPALEVAASGLIQLLRYAYDKERGNSMIDCFWHSWNFLGKHGGIHYNELITSWIMEGCLNHTNQIEKAYEEGYIVLMQLIDYHMLKMQEDNIVVLEGATFGMDEYCRRGYLATADPGLASMLKGTEEIPPFNKVLEGIAPADGMMKTGPSRWPEKLISSLLIDGSRLCREVHATFFGAMQNLNLLAIFSPRLKSPKELSLSRPEKLLVLILRGSYLLEDVNQVEELESLTVLEISGSTYLKGDFPDLFGIVSQLCSLDLSGAGITSLPDSFSELTKLRRLILKGCSSLQELPKLEKFSKLEVIDLSECTSLKKIQEESFDSLENLKVINFSHTKIEKLPKVKKHRHLKILLLKGCSELSVMCTLKRVYTLKVLDLSGATNIKEIMDDSFEGTYGLREVDLSETQIQFLPLHEGNNFLNLRLRGCKLLRNLPELGQHTLLEELDVSGCEKLENLPGLSALKKLKILCLKDCSNLNSLPDLRSLSKLEKLDLRGTKLWSQELDDFLRHDIEGLEILS